MNSRHIALVLCVLAFPASYAAADETRNAWEFTGESTANGGHASGAQDLLVRALSFIGVNYRYGGESPETGFDCSGLVRHVFRESLGLLLPRTSRDISRVGETVQRDALQPGDLVFFNTLRRGFSHVGIYLGEHRFVHAPARGGHIRIEDMRQGYWAKRFDGARRIAAADFGGEAAN
jgi:cell wall-associated NlpC family hydrolase